MLGIWQLGPPDLRNRRCGAEAWWFETGHDWRHRGTAFITDFKTEPIAYSGRSKASSKQRSTTVSGAEIPDFHAEP
jgi:hypothetical protein